MLTVQITHDKDNTMSCRPSSRRALPKKRVVVLLKCVWEEGQG